MRRPRITLMVHFAEPNRPRCAWCAHPLDVHGAYGCDTDDCRCGRTGEYSDDGQGRGLPVTTACAYGACARRLIAPAGPSAIGAIDDA